MTEYESEMIELEKQRLAIQSESQAKQALVGQLSVTASVMAALVGLGSLIFSVLAQDAASRADAQTLDAEKASNAAMQSISEARVKLDGLKFATQKN